jgi:pimeloyl-ACP methyl ester carboxylesterase
VTTKKPATETGAFLGEFPYVRFGDGPENLMILPGLTLQNEPPSRLDAWTYRLGFGRFARDHTVYVVKRKRGMPPGYTTQDMAADYGRVLEQELGPSHVMGFSTGGSIAQYVALDRPELVNNLILVITASRLSEEGRETCERWRALARQRRWRELRADMASATVTSEANKRVAGAFMGLFGGLVLGTPSDPSDFLTTLEADLGHDTTGRLPALSAPTLVIGGSEDPFYSEPLLRETAAKIPDAELRVYEGVGHGVPKERKRRYEDDALAFLKARPTSEQRRRDR